MIPEPSSGDGCFQNYMLHGCFLHTSLLNLILLIRIFQGSISFHERGFARHCTAFLSFCRCSKEQITQPYWKHDKRWKPNNCFFSYSFRQPPSHYGSSGILRRQIANFDSALLGCCAIMFFWWLKGFQDASSEIVSWIGGQQQLLSMGEHLKVLHPSSSCISSLGARHPENYVC